MPIQKFTATLNKEGSTGSVRGKIPATLVAAMGGDHGDVLEIELNGKTIVGGRLIRGKEAQRLRSQGRQNFSVAPAKVAPKKSAPAKGNGKMVGKVAPVKAASKSPAKAVAPVKKASKNKTAVKITKPAAKGKAGKVKPRFTL